MFCPKRSQQKNKWRSGRDLPKKSNGNTLAHKKLQINKFEEVSLIQTCKTLPNSYLLQFQLTLLSSEKLSELPMKKTVVLEHKQMPNSQNSHVEFKELSLGVWEKSLLGLEKLKICYGVKEEESQGFGNSLEILLLGHWYQSVDWDSSWYNSLEFH